MKNIGFLGSGFALYGYLKHFSKKNNNLITLEKYKKIIKKRKDLKKLYKKIIFKKNDNLILKYSDEIVFARRPIDQENFIKKIIKRNFKINHYYFEKPLCTNPSNSIKLFEKLKKKKIKFTMGYLLLYTKFYNKCFKNFTKNLNINWEFMAYDLKNKNKKGWKFKISKGGGPLRFYGIHFISILAKKFKNFSNIKSIIIFKNKIPIIWNCRLKLNEKTNFQVNISTFSNKNIFRVKTDKKLLYSSSTPFGNYKKNDSCDYRVKYIKKMIKHFNPNFNYISYKKSLVLWEKIENKTQFIYEM
tara:strand:+ start:97 stop:999 length:903 start_codon:yes stop_codon:yes gene_type:complete